MSVPSESTGKAFEAGPIAGRLRAVVAIPVYNEVERIGDCLRSLGAQAEIAAGELGVLLFLNNCTDGTADVVASHRSVGGVPVRVIERRFEGANAGWARREAMEAAARWLAEAGTDDGVILTTDADSRVPVDWVARNLAAIADGADAVAGRIVLDPVEAERLPAALHARGRLEGTYEALLIEIAARIDPLPHDPWPRHWTTSGATLAVRAARYREVGGLPPLAVGEDRAFVSALLTSDARVRHDPGIVVVTSGRLEGRAPGGAADTMRLRCAVPDSPCDARLETLPRALQRYAWRARLRGLWTARRLDRIHLWAPWLGVPSATARGIAQQPTFGAVMARIEGESPRLAPRPLRPAALPAQIAAARALLALMRAVTRMAARAGLPRLPVAAPALGDRPGEA